MFVGTQYIESATYHKKAFLLSLTKNLLFIPNTSICLFSLLAFLIFGCAKIPTEDDLIIKTQLRGNFHNQETLKNIGNSDINMKNLNYTQTFFTLFSDPVLKKITLQALESNTNLLTLESQIRQARATAKVNTSNLFPKVNANLNYNYSDNNYRRIQTNVTQNTTNVSFSFSWEADIFGKLNALRLASKQEILQSIQNLSQAQVILIGDVANYYFTIRQISKAIAINEEITKNLEQIYYLTEEKYKLGLIGLDSVATTKSNYLTQKNTTLNLIYALEQNKNALLILLNSNDLDFDIESKDYIFQENQLPNIKSLPSVIVFNRPDVRSSIFALNASLYRRFNKKMALFPSINLSGNLGSILFAPQQSLGDIVWQIASSLAMPILNRQSITQDYILAKENTKQAFYALQNTVNTAISEIENATKNMEITKSTLSNMQEYYDVNKSTFEIMESRYEQNLIDDISRLEYANTYLHSKNNLTSAHLVRNQAIIAFYKAFGGNFAPDPFSNDALQRDKIFQNYKKYEEKRHSLQDPANDL